MLENNRNACPDRIFNSPEVSNWNLYALNYICPLDQGKMSEETPAVDAAVAPTDVVEEQKPVAAAAEPAAAQLPQQVTSAPAATPLAKLFKELPAIIKEADHNEMWGVALADESHVPTTIVLEKFLRANTKDVSKAKAQLIEALKWRKRMEPAKLIETRTTTAPSSAIWATSPPTSCRKGRARK